MDHAPTEFQPQFHAQLIGGPFSGGKVEVPSLDSTIRVYQNGGHPFALPVEQKPPSDVSFLGTYDIVGPIGPDTPTYVVRDC
jgi:hypothetical protein